MILSLLRIESLRVEEMLKRSFSEDGNQKAAPEQSGPSRLNRNFSRDWKSWIAPFVKSIWKRFAKCRDVLDKSRRIFKELFSSTQQRLLNKTVSFGSIVIVNHFPAIYLKRIDDSSLLIAIPSDSAESNELKCPPW